MSDGIEQKTGPLDARVGDTLAAERVRQDIALSDVAARLRIPVRHLEAIEANEYATLPALPYSAGFVKSYANMLGLDGIALSRAFRDDVGNERRGHFEPEAYAPVDPSRVPSRMLAMVALGVALLLGMGYLLLRFEGDSIDLARLAADTPEEINATVPAAPAVATPAVAAPAIPTGPVLVSANERDVWVKITDQANGQILYRGVIKLGDSYTVPDTAVDPMLRTLLPQYVKVAIGETALPPVGPADTLVPSYSLKRDALVALAMAAPAPTAVPPTDGNISDAAAGLPTAPMPVQVVPGAGQDPAGSRPASARPISDDTTTARP